MNWLRRLFARRRPIPSTPDTTRPELEHEQELRRVERRRTAELARMLNDYRAQDTALRR